MNREDVVKFVVERTFKRFPLPPDHLGKVASAIVSDYEIRLPRQGETTAVALKNPKTAALCFDRLWSSSPLIPNDIVFHVGTTYETVYLTLVSIMLAFTQVSENPALASLAEELRSDWDEQFEELVDLPGETFAQLRGSLARQLCASIRLGGVNGVMPVYDSQNARVAEYRAGDAATLVTVLENVEVVNEAELSWEQVAQFREDDEARVAFRRMMHWLDADMVGKPVSFIEDEVALRLHDYDLAMKRHGIRTALGSLSTLIDSKFVAAASAGGGVAALFSGGTAGLATAVSVGGVLIALHVAENLLNRAEVERNAAGDVAFVVEARKLTR